MNWQAFGRSSWGLIEVPQHQNPDNMLVRTAGVPANTQTICLVSITAWIDLSEVKENWWKLQIVSELNRQTIKLSNIKPPAPFPVWSESPTHKTTPSANQDFYSVFLAKEHRRYLQIRSLTATATSTLPRLCTHKLFKTVKSWTPLTLQGKPCSSQELVTADSYILWYDVCAAQHIERISRTAHLMCVLLNISNEYPEPLT
jgi:ribosomal protein S10